MKKIFILVLIAAFSFSSCEKDDICDANTPTTPRLVIEFYSATPTPVLQSVTNLRAVADGMPLDEGIIFNPTITDGTKYLSNSTKIYLPLKIGVDDTTTKYSLILNSTTTGGGNTDIVTFNYSKHNVYVSRACGYKTLFNLTNTNTDIFTPDSDNWIKNTIIQKTNLENETDVHIKIYF